MTLMIHRRGYRQRAWCPSRLAKRWCNTWEYRLNSPVQHITRCLSFLYCSLRCCVHVCLPLLPSSPLLSPTLTSSRPSSETRRTLRKNKTPIQRVVKHIIIRWCMPRSIISSQTLDPRRQSWMLPRDADGAERIDGGPGVGLHLKCTGGSIACGGLRAKSELWTGLSWDLKPWQKQQIVFHFEKATHTSSI